MKPLYKHQERFLARNPDKALLVWGMGSGKTRAACEWAKLRGRQVLIVCPKGLCENWRRECEAWGVKHYTILSKETFKKSCADYAHKVLIVDEADHFYAPHFSSQLSKSLRGYIKNRKPHLLMLSATPYRSNAWNIFTAAALLGIDLNFFKFKNDFFYEIRMGFRTVPKPKPGTEAKIRALVGKIGDVFNPEDEFDIPPQIDEVVHSGESERQRYAHATNQEINHIVRFTRDHQIEAGIGVPVVSDNKLEIIRRYLEEVPKVAVVCRYREQLATYARVLREEGHQVFEIHGDVVDRSGVLDKVEKAEKCVLLLQSATCEGYEAPSVGLMVFASMDYSYRNYTQMKGRIHRMNRLKKNVYVHLVAGDCDRAIASCMEKKQDFDVLKWVKERESGVV